MRNEREGSAFWHAVWTRLQKDPAAASAVAYFWVIAVGFAHLFGSGMAFNLNVIDLASPSDFLVAGVRDPLVTLLSSVSGVGLYLAIGNAVRNARAPAVPAAIAVALLIGGAVLSFTYRWAVVFGPLWNRATTPAPVAVTLKGDVHETVQCARIGVTTANFIVFGVDPPCDGGEGGRLVVAREEVARMTLGSRNDCVCDGGVRTRVSLVPTEK